MKTPLVLSFVFFLFLGSAEAQLSFGIKSSRTQSSLSNLDDQNGKMTGMGVTFQLYKRVGKILELGIEPGLVQRGTTSRFGETNFDVICCFCAVPELCYYGFDYNANTLKSSYLQLPITAKFHVPSKKGIVDFYGKIGSGISWLASGIYQTVTYDQETFQLRHESKNIAFGDGHPFKRWEWSAQVGMGLGIKVGNGKVFFETEWQQGFTKVVEYADYKNRTLSHSLGYQINL